MTFIEKTQSGPLEPTPRKPIPRTWGRALGWRCARCTDAGVEYDHILPLELGGKHALENIQLLCRECHRVKTALDIKRIAKARRLRRDADPTTRRQPVRKLRGRGFQGKDPLKP